MVWTPESAGRRHPAGAEYYHYDQAGLAGWARRAYRRPAARPGRTGAGPGRQGGNGRSTPQTSLRLPTPRSALQRARIGATAPSALRHRTRTHRRGCSADRHKRTPRSNRVSASSPLTTAVSPNGWKPHDPATGSGRRITGLGADIQELRDPGIGSQVAHCPAQESAVLHLHQLRLRRRLRSPSAQPPGQRRSYRDHRARSHSSAPSKRPWCRCQTETWCWSR
jgi:hypothetical protein